MKKAEESMRASYKRSDFATVERGRFRNEVVGGAHGALPKPEIHKAFPTSEAVNAALATMLAIAKETQYLVAKPKRPAKKRATA